MRLSRGWPFFPRRGQCTRSICILPARRAGDGPVGHAFTFPASITDSFCLLTTGRMRISRAPPYAEFLRTVSRFQRTLTNRHDARFSPDFSTDFRVSTSGCYASSARYIVAFRFIHGEWLIAWYSRSRFPVAWDVSTARGWGFFPVHVSG